MGDEKVCTNSTIEYCRSVVGLACVTYIADVLIEDRHGNSDWKDQSLVSRDGVEEMSILEAVLSTGRAGWHLERSMLIAESRSDRSYLGRAGSISRLRRPRL